MLPVNAPEQQILTDSNVILVVCTVSALRLRSEAGALLREALARRGVRRILFDEMHTLLDASMAGWSDDLADCGPALDALCAASRRRGHLERPQHIGFTSTMPASLVRQAADATRMQHGVRVVRCSIDRPDLSFYRLPLPARNGEKRLVWAQRVLDQLVDTVPTWAVAGSVVVFCPTAKFARRAVECIRMCDSRGRSRPMLVYLGVQNMSRMERAAAKDSFDHSPTAVLFTTEAYSHGAGKPNISLVVHLALPRGPIELFQRSGRGAREANEKALVVFAVSAHMLGQRLSLCRPTDADAVGGVHSQLEHLTGHVCLRSSLLGYLGEPNLVLPCSGCDLCGGAHLQGLPHLLTWEDGTAAAISLCQSVQQLGADGVSLGRLLGSIPAHTPAPFAAYERHCELVVALLGDGTLSFDACDDGRGHCFARCSVNGRLFRALRNGRRRVDVHTLGVAVSEPRSADVPAVELDTPLSDSAREGLHQAMLDVAQAEALLQGAHRRVRRHLSTEESPGAVFDLLSSLPPSQNSLLFPGQ
eukprot:4307170-Prymnesium_polylepis.2